MFRNFRSFPQFLQFSAVFAEFPLIRVTSLREEDGEYSSRREAGGPDAVTRP